MSDCSADAIFFVAEGALWVSNPIRGYEGRFAEFAKPGAGFVGKQHLVEVNHAYLVWTASPPDSSSELASDRFVIHNVSIRMQLFTAKVNPKR